MNTPQNLRYLFFSVSLVALILIFKPQLISALCALQTHLVASLLGAIPYQHNIITPRAVIHIAHVCSGFKTLSVFLPIFAIYSYPYQKRYLLTLSAIPLTILANTLRITICALWLDHHLPNFPLCHQLAGILACALPPLLLLIITPKKP